MTYAEIDTGVVPPRVVIPRAYNAATDFIDRHVAQGRGDRVAIRDDRGTVTYAALADRTARAGNALRSLGVQPEQRVALCMLDSADFVAVFWGAIKIGAVPVPLNTLLVAQDYGYLLQDSRATVLVVSDALVPRIRPALGTSPWLRTVIAATSTVSDATGRAEDTPGTALPRLDDLLAAASPTLDPAPTTRDDVAFWLYSSGSTGSPKGAMHLHGHLAYTAALYGRGVLGIRETDVVYSAARLFFAYGLGNAMTFPLSVGATAVLTEARPTPAAVMHVLRTHQPTLFCGVPTLFAAMLADPACAVEDGSRALRLSISAGEALPRHVGEHWRARVGTDILDGIGSTELLHIFISNRPGDVRYGTSGRPVPGYELRLLGEDGMGVSDGDEGSLWVRGPSAAVAYWNNREGSLQTFHGPWTRTGDRYIRDADGYYTYSGRADDMLKVGGIWVSPFEVESAVASHPAVLEAAVVGHADDEGLTKPKAYVVLRNPALATPALAEALKDHVKARLALYKYPRWVEFVSELPRTATGKIQRYRLRA